LLYLDPDTGTGLAESGSGFKQKVLMKKSGNSHIFHYLLESNETGINITLDTIGYILVYSLFNFENKEYGKGLSQNAIEHKV
jgi:hypothetical protein